MSTLSTLAVAWAQAKADEDAAKARRYEIEKEIVAALPTNKTEGSTRADIDGLRVTVTHSVIRTLDTDAVRAAWDSIPLTAHGAIRWKADLDTRAYRALPEPAAQALTQFITTKPAKPSVKVEAIDPAKE